MRGRVITEKTISAFLRHWLKLWPFNLQHAAGRHRDPSRNIFT